MEKVKQNKKWLITVVLSAAILSLLLVRAAGEPDWTWPSQIEQFENGGLAYAAEVAEGTEGEDLELPEQLRAVISLDEADLGTGAFTQTQPDAQDLESYGYTAPDNAAELYASGLLVLYETDGQEYRVYGSVSGSDPAWFVCDVDGNITDVVLDIPVTWSGDYDLDTPGEYVLTASFSGYTYAEARPYAVITVEASTSSTSDNLYSPGEDAYYEYIWNGILAEFEWASAADMGSDVSAPWTGTATKPAETVIIQSSYNPSLPSVEGWKVYTGAELRWCIENHVSFQLQNDIDLGGAIGKEWTSIVESQAAGKGWTGSNLTILDFGNHTIYNMYVTGKYSSLLGTASNKNLYVENLNLRNFRVGSDADVASGNTRLAALCNSIGKMTIYNVHLYDGVAQGGNYVAGLINGDNGDVQGNYDEIAMQTVSSPATTVVNVGLERVHVYSAGHGAGFATNTWGLSIENCYSLDCTVVVPSGHSGGFVSCIRGLKANNCFTNAEVYGEDMTGVFIGMMHDGTYLVENCFAFGSIEGVEDIGGFVASTEPEDSRTGYIDATFRNCYSTSIVGMQNGGSYMGGFMGALYSSGILDKTGTYFSYTEITFENCYAAGEVGGADTAVDEDRKTHTTVGGFIGTLEDREGTHTDKPSSATFINCYYDKQTTAMREWAVGEYRLDDESGRLDDVTGNNDLDITGVLTTETVKSGAGLTSGVGESGFVGFTENSEWVFVSNSYDSYYPQVSTAYNAKAESSGRTAKWESGDGWSSEKEAALVRAASAASAATVFLATWEQDYDGQALPWTTYDTVRDLTISFTATSDTSESLNWKGDGAESKLYGDISLSILTLSRDDEGVWQVSVGSIGTSWLEVAATDSGQTAYRSLRLIPTMALDAGEDTEVEPGGYYDHADDVWIGYSTAGRLAANSTDITLGIYPDQINDNSPWSTIQQDIEPNKGGLGSSSSYYLVLGDDSFDDAATDDITTDSTFRRVDITHTRAVRNGTLVDISEPVEDLYDSPPSASADKWNAKKLFILEDQGVYEITYYWQIADGRYLQDTKYVTIMVTSIPIQKTMVGLPKDGTQEYSFSFDSVKVEWDGETQTWVELDRTEGSEDYNERVTITVTGMEPEATSDISFDLEGTGLDPGPHYFKVYEIAGDDGRVSYDASYYIVEIYIDENGKVDTLNTPITVKYYTSDGLLVEEYEWNESDPLTFENSILDDIELKKVSVNEYGDPLPGAAFRLYYTVETLDGGEMKYYYQYVDDDGNGSPATSWTRDEDEATELTSDKDGMIYAYDLSMNTTYYLEETKAPDDYFDLDSVIRIYWDYAGNVQMELYAVLVSTHQTLPQNPSGIYLVVNTPKGVISGLAWVDADGDGIRETSEGGDDAYVPSSDGAYATVGGEVIPASAESLFDLVGLTATLMRNVDGVWEEVTDNDGKAVQVELLADADGAEASEYTCTYTRTSGGEGTYIITARADDNYGYYFGGLTSGTYAVRFSTEKFALGAYEAAMQNAGNDDTVDSDAAGRYVNSESGAEGKTNGDGYWLSSTIVEDITIPSVTGQGHEAYLSMNNDSGLVPRLGSITITKSDDAGNKLSGVTFQLEVLMTLAGDGKDSADWTTLYSGADDTNETDGRGELTYKDLWPGTYRLTETGSTSGNSLLAEAVYITIPYSMGDGDEGSTEAATTDPSYRWDGVSYWLDLVYDITNQAIFPLPVSGGWGTMWYFIAGGCLILLGGAVTLGVTAGRRRMRLRLLRDTLFKW